jgi:molecular chaperone GrpE
MAPLAQADNLHLLPEADLGEEIERLKDELRKEREQHVRTLADFKNYRRRLAKDGSRLVEEGKREDLLSLLNILDDMDNALRWTSHGEQGLMKGVSIIHKKLVALLEAQGVRAFDSVGTPFTPHRHEAIAVIRRTDVEPGTVVEVLRQGFLWKDELLRPAQVQVAE